MSIRGANSSWVPHPAGPGLSRSLPPLRVFFDSCDGFFTNYNWREDHLQRMVAQAGERLADVYVGVDVFARSNVVGGRFDTDKVGGGVYIRAAGLHVLCGLCLGDPPFSLVPQRKLGHSGAPGTRPVSLPATPPVTRKDPVPTPASFLIGTDFPLSHVHRLWSILSDLE